MQLKNMYLDKGHPNRPGTKLDKVTGVVVHWTANEAKGADAEANRNYFNRKYKTVSGKAQEAGGGAFRFASAHLNVDDRELVECLPWKKGQAELAYHVGATTYMSGITTKLGTTYPNNRTIGLEICVNADGNFLQAYANAIAVTAMMLKEHGLTVNSLYRHYDITGKLCPGFHTQDSYAKKYLNTTADAAWKAFKSSVDKVLNPPAPPVVKPTTPAPTPTPAPVKEEATLVREDNLAAVPSWAQKSVDKAIAKKIISDPVGTHDFYRLIVILDNLKLLD